MPAAMETTIGRVRRNSGASGASRAATCWGLTATTMTDAPAVAARASACALTAKSRCRLARASAATSATLSCSGSVPRRRQPAHERAAHIAAAQNRRRLRPHVADCSQCRLRPRPKERRADTHDGRSLA